nr:M14 family zinc carboxypeptidase [Tessaracoccus sp. OS52]
MALLVALLVIAALGLVRPVPATADTSDGSWVYTTPGKHSVNGREWRTACEQYSSTVWRCRTEILADTVVRSGGRYVQRTAYVFNNLTYLASPRKNWSGNPLAENREWTADDGRRWRTECDTAETGRNGCRTWAEASVVARQGHGFVQETKLVFNNIVLFAEGVIQEPGVAPVPYESRQLIGHSVQGREIWAYQVGDPSATKVALILGQMHGEEPAGTLSAWGIINDHRSVKGIQLWVVPSMNPDGAAVRKRQNANGVDLNRNWPINYEANEPGTRYYAGTGPLSEPESKAMSEFIAAVQPQQMVSIHQPLTGVDNYKIKDRGLHDALVRELGLPSRSLDCGGDCRGTMTQWVNATTRGAAITIEYPIDVSDHYSAITARDGLVRAVGGTY